LLRKQWRSIMIAVVFLVYLVLTVFLNLAFHRYVPRQQRLPDLGHEVIPRITPQYAMWTDAPLNCLFFLAGVVLLGSLKSCLGVRLYLKETPFVVNMVRRFGVLYAMGHGLRALSYLATSVPGGHEECLDPASVNRRRPTLTQVFLHSASVETNCGDLMFSGHILLCALITCMTYRYAAASLGISQRAALGLTAVGVGLTLTQAVLILAARHHYTSDVVVALYVTPMLFYWWSYTVDPVDLQPDHERIAHAIVLRKEWWTAFNLFPIREDKPEFVMYA